MDCGVSFFRSKKVTICIQIVFLSFFRFVPMSVQNSSSSSSCCRCRCGCGCCRTSFLRAEDFAALFPRADPSNELPASKSSHVLKLLPADFFRNEVTLKGAAVFVLAGLVSRVSDVALSPAAPNLSFSSSYSMPMSSRLRTSYLESIL
jgi:hypothetical protein